ncbi:MAG: glutamate ligase domain-containing protein, partial [Streptosporangiaceae bacterium]
AVEAFARADAMDLAAGAGETPSAAAAGLSRYARADLVAMPAGTRQRAGGRDLTGLDGAEVFSADPAQRDVADQLDISLVRDAVAAMTSPGRLEVLRRGPLMVVDAAHNPAGMTATVAALAESFTFSALIAVLSISADKDVSGILDQLEPIATHLIATSNSSGRAIDAEELADVAHGVFGADRVTLVPRLDEAIERAVALADEADAHGGGEPGGAMILIGGSVITAGEARLLLRRDRPDGDCS